MNFKVPSYIKAGVYRYKKRFSNIILIIIWCTTSAYYLRKKIILYSCPPLTSLSVLWQLPQVSVLLWQEFCCDNHMLFATKVSLSWQNFCHNKIVCHDKIFLLQQNFCQDKHMFVTTSILLSWQKTCFVMINTCLLRQKKACYDKTLVTTKLCLSWQKYFCRNKGFVVTSILLSQQKTCFVVTNTCLSWQTCVCHDKNYTCGSFHQWYLSTPPMNFSGVLMMN